MAPAPTMASPPCAGVPPASEVLRIAFHPREFDSHWPLHEDVPQ